MVLMTVSVVKHTGATLSLSLDTPEVQVAFAGLMQVLPADNGDAGRVELLVVAPSLVAHEASADDGHSAVAVRVLNALVLQQKRGTAAVRRFQPHSMLDMLKVTHPGQMTKGAYPACLACCTEAHRCHVSGPACNRPGRPAWHARLAGWSRSVCRAVPDDTLRYVCTHVSYAVRGSPQTLP